VGTHDADQPFEDALATPIATQPIVPKCDPEAARRWGGVWERNGHRGIEDRGQRW
jgi:hypothetical protein